MRSLLRLLLVPLIAATIGCDPPPVSAPTCSTEPLVAYGGYLEDGVLEVVLLAPFKANSGTHLFDTVQPQDVFGAALLKQEGDNYLRVDVLPEDQATQVVIKGAQICAPPGTDPTDGSLYPHFQLIVDLPASNEAGDPVQVAIISDDNAV
jgi:hypothetical protein